TGPRTPVVAGYESFREIARGGQGVIYSAIQASTRRLVAIKVLLDGSWSSVATQQRFEREIELVASLEHPGIVRVYDSGRTEDGRLCLIMELVEGDPLDRHARRRRESADHNEDIEETATLFAAIADAVQAAHQRGVIHRDLKPSNVLVNERNAPRVLDFGLARALVPEGLDPHRPTVSRSGQFLGSVPWASPEQVAGTPDAMDVRTDVYAIGVMLHEALTGAFPYRVDGSIAETLRNIVESEPSRPGAVRRAIPADLDAIVGSCLAKDPGRRYQSAAELAADLRSFLGGEAIRARRDSAWRSMGRTLGRYRRASIASVVASVALLAIAAVAWRQASIAEQERAVAQERFDQVRAVANSLLFELHDAIEPLAGSRGAREQLVTTALTYLRALQPDAGDDPDFAAELAAAYERVGDIEGNPHQPNLGHIVNALASYREALALRRRIADQRPDDPQALRSLARTLNLTGDVILWTGDTGGALAAYREAAEVLDRALRMDATERGIQRELLANLSKTGDVLSDRHEPEQSLESLRRALVVAQKLAEDPSSPRDQVNLCVSHSKISFVLLSAGETASALDHARQAVSVAQRVAEAEPDNASYARNWSVQLNQLAAVLVASGQLEEARRHLEVSLGIVQRLRSADLDEPLLASDEAYTLNKLGEVGLADDRPAEARGWFVQALDLRRQLAERDPANAAFRRAYGVAMSLVSAAEQALAADTTRSLDDRIADLASAESRMVGAAEVFEGMQAAGTLIKSDAELPATCRSQARQCAERRAALAASAAAPGDTVGP
ncbi:MAG: protein kinase, partial [Phycisphaerales bacterium]|nr:protein kinase [Phycisphaerales bacterium]